MQGFLKFMKYELQPHQDIKKDLLHWAKEYLVIKALEYFEKSTENSIDDIIDSIEKIKSSVNIDDAKANANDLVKHGLASMSRIISSIGKLYTFISNKIDYIKEVDTNLLGLYKAWLTVSSSTKKSYIDSALEFFTFIQRNNSEHYKFDIDESIVKIKQKSIPKKMIDVMDDVEFERFSKALPKYTYKTEYEKARNILMCRLFMFSGITTSELMNLKLNESLFVQGTDFIIRLPNRKRDIDLPRKLLINYYNKYKELSLTQKEYDIDNELLISLSKKHILHIVKTLLEFADIKREPLTPQLLRYSFLTYIYNKRCESNEITFKTIHEISGIINKKELERILFTFDKESVSISKVFYVDKF